MVIIGTRPEAIKMAPVVKQLRRYECTIRTQLVLTGQHGELVDEVLNIFDLNPEIDLDLMQRSQTLSQFTGRALAALTDLFLHERPDLVLVQGDTTTVFVASLAAFYQGIQVGHVEAGLRTRDKANPFPEEINRRLTGVLADLHFAPTEESRTNLLREQVPASRIFVTGNPVIDALHMTREKALHVALKQFPFLGNGLRTVLVTAHRRENHGEPLARICRAVVKLAEQHGDVQILWPVHPNPEVFDTVHRLVRNRAGIHLVDPLGYSAFVGTMQAATLVLTDSGGVQEEAPALGRPVLVLRETTERPEGVSSGTVKLIGTAENDIIEQASLLLTDADAYSRMANAICPYGDGKAAPRIVEAILRHWNLQTEFARSAPALLERPQSATSMGVV
jgi:UDP-N-acetylglucosamine 2-epimerase (non-hydrolysing)